MVCWLIDDVEDIVQAERQQQHAATWNRETVDGTEWESALSAGSEWWQWQSTHTSRSVEGQAGSAGLTTSDQAAQLRQGVRGSRSW